MCRHLTSASRKRRDMNARQDLRHGHRVHREVLALAGGDGRRSRRVPCRQKTSPAFVEQVAAGKTRVKDGGGQQLHTRVPSELRRAFTCGDAVALRVEREDGDLQTVDQLTKTMLPVAARRVEPSQFLNVQQSALERPLGTRRRRNQCIHFTDQQVDVGGMRQEHHRTGVKGPASVARLQ
jgi:hypothetical protein